MVANRAVRCECIKRQLEQYRSGRSGIPKELARLTLADLERKYRTWGTASLGQLIAAACDYVNNFAHGGSGNCLLLIGPHEIGTEISVAILNDLLSRGFEGSYYRWGKLFQSYQDTVYDENPSRQNASQLALYTGLDVPHLVVLDRIEDGVNREWRWEAANLLISKRHGSLLPTIICTALPNLPSTFGDDGMEYKGPSRVTLTDAVGERTRSRLHEMCKILEFWRYDPLSVDGLYWRLRGLAERGGESLELSIEYKAGFFAPVMPGIRSDLGGNFLLRHGTGMEGAKYLKVGDLLKFINERRRKGQENANHILVNTYRSRGYRSTVVGSRLRRDDRGVRYVLSPFEPSQDSL